MLIEQPQLRPEVSIRWLTIACFEIRVGDFRIVIDPCIGESPRAPFGPEVIEGADIVLLSHTHWDHITDLAYVMEKFHCPVLCGELSAPALIEMLNANPHDVYPVTPNLELDFGGARVRALFARHTNQHCTHADLTDPAHQRPWVNTPQRLACGNFGDLEYRDYLITTPGGLKIMFWGSNATPEQLGIIRELKPDIAIITNIGTMHIEHLGSREGILQAKLEIFRGVPKNGVGVFNGDEPLLWNVRADGGHKKYYFGIENHACDVFATDIQELEDGMRFVVSGFGHRFELFVPVLGRHTVYNALAAVTAALLLKIPPETIQAQISGFQNTGMRQKIYERDGFTIIEDCYNAGPESTEAALDILAGFRARAKGRCIAVLGDMLELGNRSAAEHYRIGRIAAAKVDMLYTYGTNSERMVSGAITGGMKQKFVEHFDTHEDLAHMLKMRARPGDVILFKGSRGMRMEKALSLFLKEEES